MAANACETIAVPAPVSGVARYFTHLACEQIVLSTSSAVGRFRNPFNAPFQTPTHHVDLRREILRMIDPSFLEIFRAD